ncbi:MAG: hypothetical protein JKY37_18505 [Nannocystaceae bacterium]|nr:hypothetical protein [Nannocystaceae bacterium]
MGVVVALLSGCGPDTGIVEERYLGELVERCTVSGLGQTRGTIQDFELVVTTGDKLHYRTNLPICEPDADATATDMLELRETECTHDPFGEGTEELHLIEGELSFEGNSVSVLYRWTRLWTWDGTMSNCEVDNVLERVTMRG